MPITYLKGYPKDDSVDYRTEGAKCTRPYRPWICKGKTTCNIVEGYCVADRSNEKLYKHIKEVIDESEQHRSLLGRELLDELQKLYDMAKYYSLKEDKAILSMIKGFQNTLKSTKNDRDALMPDHLPEELETGLDKIESQINDPDDIETFHDQRRIVLNQMAQFSLEDRDLIDWGDWKQGQPGLNDFIKEKFRELSYIAGSYKFNIKCKKQGDPPSYFAYQIVPSILVKPRSPIERLLIAHRTGAGKTAILNKILDNFYYDPRPKILLFPLQSIKNNFFQELMKNEFPNKWKRYIEAVYPTFNKPPNSPELSVLYKNDYLNADGTPLSAREKTALRTKKNKVVNICAEICKLPRNLNNVPIPVKLESGKYGTFCEPAAPLRGFLYQAAGGGATKHDAIFKYRGELRPATTKEQLECLDRIIWPIYDEARDGNEDYEMEIR